MTCGYPPQNNSTCLVKCQQNLANEGGKGGGTDWGKVGKVTYYGGKAAVEITLGIIAVATGLASVEFGVGVPIVAGGLWEIKEGIEDISDAVDAANKPSGNSSGTDTPTDEPDSGDKNDDTTGSIDSGDSNDDDDDQGSNPGAWAGGGDDTGDDGESTDGGDTGEGGESTDGGDTGEGGVLVKPTNPEWDAGSFGGQGTFYDPHPLIFIFSGSGGYTDPSPEDIGSVGSLILAGADTGTAPQGGPHRPGGFYTDFGPNGPQSRGNNGQFGNNHLVDPLYDPVP